MADGPPWAFLVQAGLATERAFDMSMVQYALGAIGTMSSWLLMQKVGRRKLCESRCTVSSFVTCTGLTHSTCQRRHLGYGRPGGPASHDR